MATSGLDVSSFDTLEDAVPPCPLDASRRAIRSRSRSTDAVRLNGCRLTCSNKQGLGVSGADLRSAARAPSSTIAEQSRLVLTGSARAYNPQTMKNYRKELWFEVPSRRAL